MNLLLDMRSYGLRPNVNSMEGSPASKAGRHHHHANQQRLNGDVVFKICIMCLANVHDLQVKCYRCFVEGCTCCLVCSLIFSLAFDLDQNRCLYETTLFFHRPNATKWHPNAVFGPRKTVDLRAK